MIEYYQKLIFFYMRVPTDTHEKQENTVDEKLAKGGANLQIHVFRIILRKLRVPDSY